MTNIYELHTLWPHPNGNYRALEPFSFRFQAAQDDDDDDDDDNDDGGGGGGGGTLTI